MTYRLNTHTPSSITPYFDYTVARDAPEPQPRGNDFFAPSSTTVCVFRAPRPFNDDAVDGHDRVRFRTYMYVLLRTCGSAVASGFSRGTRALLPSTYLAPGSLPLSRSPSLLTTFCIFSANYILLESFGFFRFLLCGERVEGMFESKSFNV